VFFHMIRLLRCSKALRRLYELYKGNYCGKHKVHKNSDVAVQFQKNMCRFLIRTSPDVSDQTKDGKRRKTLGRLGKWVMLARKPEGNT
jgi:hypothetical protein